ncbi:AGL178W family transposase, partial [Vanderwaltozyma polyspora DSM 70294]
MPRATPTKSRLSETKIGGSIPPEEKFTGTEDAAKLHVFITNMGMRMDTRQLDTDAEKIAFLCDRLYGTAGVWAAQCYRNSPGCTYESFKTKFVEHYAHKIDHHKIINQLLNMKEDTLGLEDYNLKFTEYAALFPPSMTIDKFLVSIYLRG